MARRLSPSHNASHRANPSTSPTLSEKMPAVVVEVPFLTSLSIQEGDDEKFDNKLYSFLDPNDSNLDPHDSNLDPNDSILDPNILTKNISKKIITLNKKISTMKMNNIEPIELSPKNNETPIISVENGLSERCVFSIDF